MKVRCKLKSDSKNSIDHELLMLQHRTALCRTSSDTMAKWLPLSCQLWSTNSGFQGSGHACVAFASVPGKVLVLSSVSPFFPWSLPMGNKIKLQNKEPTRSLMPTHLWPVGHVKSFLPFIKRELPLLWIVEMFVYSAFCTGHQIHFQKASENMVLTFTFWTSMCRSSVHARSALAFLDTHALWCLKQDCDYVAQVQASLPREHFQNSWETAGQHNTRSNLPTPSINLHSHWTDRSRPGKLSF